MEKYRNIFGQLEYRRGAFFVTKKRDISAQYAVLKWDAWTVTDALIFPVWDKPVFDSFIQAVRFLKENINDLF